MVWPPPPQNAAHAMAPTVNHQSACSVKLDYFQNHANNPVASQYVLISGIILPRQLAETIWSLYFFSSESFYLGYSSFQWQAMDSSLQICLSLEFYWTIQLYKISLPTKAATKKKRFCLECVATSANSTKGKKSSSVIILLKL